MATKQTLDAVVLAALRQGRALTSGDAWREFGTSRLAAVIHRLRKRGWPITAKLINATCRDGRIARIAEYALGAPYELQG